LFRANLSVDQVDWLHQANQRILDAVAERMNIPSHKVISNLAHWNTSAASIPSRLMKPCGRVRFNQMISLPPPAGAGLTWEPQFFIGAGEES